MCANSGCFNIALVPRALVQPCTVVTVPGHNECMQHEYILLDSDQGTSYLMVACWSSARVGRFGLQTNMQVKHARGPLPLTWVEKRTSFLGFANKLQLSDSLRRVSAITKRAARSNARSHFSRNLISCSAAVDPGTLHDTGSPGPRLQPTDRVLKLWRKANAVCFDVDCKQSGIRRSSTLEASLFHAPRRVCEHNFNTIRSSGAWFFTVQPLVWSLPN